MKKRVLVVGGGPSALTMAWHLTTHPECAGRYEITVLQMGWRLGGKGASGRDRADHDRILEHGLHIMFGFYDNFFHMITRAYDALGRAPDAPLATWQQAFVPHDVGTVMDCYEGEWAPISIAFPRNGAVPGEGGVLNDSAVAFGALVGGAVQVAFGWAGLERLDELLHGDANEGGLLPPDPRAGSSDALVRWTLRRLAAVLAAAGDLTEAIEARGGMILRIVEELSRLANVFVDVLGHVNREVRLVVQGLDFVGALVRGVVADEVLLYGGYTAIDRYEFADWLVRHGLAESSRDSLGVRFLYDAAFSYVYGNARTPSMAAGVAVRTLLRMAGTYKGAFFYKMASGMGDVIVAPLYEVLAQKGVRFGFFHKVEEIVPHPTEPRVARVRARVQARLKSGDPWSYRPLFDSKGLPSWPSAPDLDQLADPDAVSGIDLESYYATYPDDDLVDFVAGEDFDEIVVATPVPCLPFIAPALIARSPRWQRMVQHVASVPTMALQVWFDRDLRELGWDGPDSPLLSLFVDPLNTWSDMSVVLAREDWPVAGAPRSVAYYCGAQEWVGPPPPVTDTTWPARMKDAARAASLSFIRDDLRWLYPSAIRPDGTFDWSVVHAADHLAGEARFTAQYWRSNCEPPEWCTLALPDTNRHRLPAGDTDFDNLRVCGDWIDNGLYVACLEGAVMGGIYAARAVSGVRIPILGEELDEGLIAGKAPAIAAFGRERRVKVAVLGSGVGSLVAAFSLATSPDAHRYDITVYQYGWRLGGKGASGRNAKEHDRIEEHGLHIWGGSYYNAFRVMQDVYAEAARPADAPLSTWYDPDHEHRSAFWPHSTVSVADDFGGTWSFWTIDLPTNDELPGRGTLVDEPTSYLRMAAELILELLTGRDLFDRAPAAEPTTLFGRIVRRFEQVVDRVDEPFEATIRAVAGRLALDGPTRLVAVLVALRSAIRPVLERLGDHRDSLRWSLEAIDLGVTVVRGLVEDDLFERGFDTVDSEQFVAWLRRHGASDLTLDGLLVRGWHDYFFGLRDGRTMSLSAATALRTILRFVFTYKGAFFFKMRAGMGDAIFAPMWEALERRGVKFAFFHRVTELSCAGEDGALTDEVQTIHVDRQLDLAPGVAAYRPLVDVKGVPCFPSEPDWSQLDPAQSAPYQADPSRLESWWGGVTPVARLVLRRGEGFDLVVCGLSSKPLQTVAPTLLERSPALARAAQLSTVQTCAAQLWLDTSARDMGWIEGSTVGTAYQDPQNTWAEMTELLAAESWEGAPVTPKSLVYLCGVYPDADPIPPASDARFPTENALRVLDFTGAWLSREWGRLYPSAVEPGTLGLDWARLIAPPELEGPARLSAQFWRGNIDPSERYVLSEPGSAAQRSRADGFGLRNFVGAGDWLYTGLNAGCVEAGAMGGLQAARAISGAPRRIPGDDGLFGR